MDIYWMRYGACAAQDPSIFFPTDGVGVEVAKQICEGCRVKRHCLEYALEEGIAEGVWGGTSARQRVRIRKRRSAEAAGG